MSDFSVDGLSSGLDTTAIIEQLMAVERQPVVRLEARRNTLDAKMNAWEDLDRRLDNLTKAIELLTDDSGLNVMNGDASNPDVLVTPIGESATGLFEMTVDQVATSHQLMSARFDGPVTPYGAGRATVTSGLAGIGASASDIGSSDSGHYSVQVTSVDGGVATIIFNGESHDVSSSVPANITNEDGSTLSLTPDGEFTVGAATISTVITSATTSIGAVVSQLNDPSSGATLQVIDTGDGTATPFTIVATARTPGLDSAVVLDLDVGGGAFTEIREATNTIVTMGSGGLTIERSGVNVEGLVPGMALDLSAAEPGEELRVTVARDDAAAIENVKKFVTAANSFFSGVTSYAKSDPENNVIGLLAGESSLRRLTDQIRGSFSAVGTGAFVIGNQVGISFSQEGTISLDETKLAEILTGDFGNLQQFLVGDGTDSFLGRIQAAVDVATDTDGTIDNATTNLDANLDDVDNSISRYERRLDIVEAGYRRQFTAMETLLAQLNSQSSFLASNLAGLG